MKKVLFLLSVFLLSSSFTIQQEYVLRKGYTVAFSKNGFDKMMDAVSNKDEQYFQRLIDNQVIMNLPNEIPVYLVESHSFSGYSEVRVKGKDIRLWTVNEALKKVN